MSNGQQTSSPTEAMAPPMKRRRLFFWEMDEQPVQFDSTPSFSHTVTHLEPQPTASATTVEEVHIEFRDRPLTPTQEREIYLHKLRRQESVSSAAESATSAPATGAAPLSSTPTPSSSSSSSSSSASSTDSTSSLSTSATFSASASASTQSSFTLSSFSFSSTAIINPSGTASSTASLPGSASGNTTASFSQPSLSGTINNTAFPTSAGLNLTASGFPFASNGSSSATTSGSVGLLATYSPTRSSSTISRTASDGDDVATSVIYSTATLSQNGQPVSTITTAIGVAGYGPQATPSTSTTTPSTSGNGNRPDPPPPGTIAGGVVGGAAGLAVLLLVAMLFLRWYRRKRQLGHQPIPPGSAGLSSGADQGPSPRGGPGMAERAGLLPLAAAVPALFRHQPQHYPDQTLGPSLGPERGFQRVSGRKLPSAFSEGMVSAPPPSMPLVGPEHNMSTTSFYHDRPGNHARVAANPFADRPDSTSPDARPEFSHHSSSEQMTVVPGPERRPTVHAGGPYNITSGPGAVDTASPIRTSGTAASLHRSETPLSMEASRGSRFLEEV